MPPVFATPRQVPPKQNTIRTSSEIRVFGPTRNEVLTMRSASNRRLSVSVIKRPPRARADKPDNKPNYRLLAGGQTEFVCQRKPCYDDLLTQEPASFMNLTSDYPFWSVNNGLPACYPSLQRDVSCDAVVVGGGITGSLVAVHLAEAGVKTVLIDKRENGT